MKMFKLKKGQEEMIGFALIIVLVAVILLVFLWFSSTQGNEESLNSVEVENFLNSYLQYTSSCTDDFSGYRTTRDLVSDCNPDSQNEVCGNMTACEALDTTSESILNNSWQVGENRPDKGYELEITRQEEDSNAAPETLVNVTKGNVSTSTYRGGIRQYPQGNYNYEITLRVYS